MTRARTRIPLLPDFNLGNRQRRTHRYLDGVREVLARGLLSPIDDGAFPHATGVSGAFAPAADQAVTLAGDHFLQDGVQATATTDDGLLNAEILWTEVIPGIAGNDRTITITDNAGATVITVVGDDIAIACDITGGITAATLVADVLADATARELIFGTLVGTGAVAITAQAELAFTGGIGEGDYGVEIATVAQTVLNWSDTSIGAELDLSGYSSGDLVEVIVIADGIEYRMNVLAQVGGGPPAAGRAGVGYIDFTNQTDDAVPDTIVVGTETWTAVNGLAAPAQLSFESATGAVATDAAAFVAAINHATEGSDLVSAHVIAGSTVVALVPRNPGVAGNFVITATIAAGGTDQDMQGGAADAFEGGYPLSYVITAADVAHWAAGRYVPVACYPFTDQPELISMLFVRPGAGFDEIGSAFTTRVRWVQSDTNFWVLEILDPAPADFQNLDELRIVVGQ